MPLNQLPITSYLSSSSSTRTPSASASATPQPRDRTIRRSERSLILSSILTSAGQPPCPSPIVLVDDEDEQYHTLPAAMAAVAGLSFCNWQNLTFANRENELVAPSLSLPTWLDTFSSSDRFVDQANLILFGKDKETQRSLSLDAPAPGDLSGFSLSMDIDSLRYSTTTLKLNSAITLSTIDKIFQKFY